MNSAGDAGAFPALSLREDPRPGDAAEIRRIVAGSGFFSSEEIDVAVELIEERLERGLASGYHFLFAEEIERTGTESPGPARLVGYSCHGPIAATASSFDLYWIAIDPEHRSRGLGTWLLRETEARIRALGGARVYVETSSRALYDPTRTFYQSRGYEEAAVLRDFYAPDDGKVIYCRVVA